MAETPQSAHDSHYHVLVDCLRKARRDANVTQADLAAQLETDQSYVSKYERGERRVDLIEVRAICRALGQDLVEFVKSFETTLVKRGL